MKILNLDGNSLTIEDVYIYARGASSEFQVSIPEVGISQVQKARKKVEEIVEKGDPVYGINTGFGALSEKHISKSDLGTLQLNLIRSHCTGVGSNFDRTITRAIMIIRANCLISGYSGVCVETLLLLLDFINNDILPCIPKKGSVGASGDLAPLSHLALSLIGEGEVQYKGAIMPSLDAIKAIGKKPISLKAKEGLALINGTSVMNAIGAICCFEAKKLAITSDIAAAMTLEASRGTTAAFDKDISFLKPHPGQLQVCDNLNALLSEGSEIMDSHKDCGKVQDPYSLRCIPQVHGAIRQTIIHAEEVVTRELNSVTDNPLIFVDKNKVVSGGNFHGEALALVMDYLAMGLSEFCCISERRVEKLMNPVFSGLPAFLTPNSGLNSGLMIAQVTMAALVSENKSLCHPASVDSVPTSTDKEDHVSMGVTAGLKLMSVLENLKHCQAIEFLCGFQGLCLLRPLKTTPSLDKVYTEILKKVDPITEDRVFHYDMKAIYKMVDDFRFVDLLSEKALQ